MAKSYVCLSFSVKSLLGQGRWLAGQRGLSAGLTARVPSPILHSGRREPVIEDVLWHVLVCIGTAHLHSHTYTIHASHTEKQVNKSNIYVETIIQKQNYELLTKICEEQQKQMPVSLLSQGSLFSKRQDELSSSFSNPVHVHSNFKEKGS